MVGVLVEQPARDARGQHRLAARDDADRLHQLVGRGVLQQEATGAGAERLHHVLVEIERGQHEHLRRTVPARPRDLTRRLDAVHPRHPDVHQHHIGLQRPHLVERLEAVTGLSHHREITLRLQDHPEAGAQQRLVVDQ